MTSSSSAYDQEQSMILFHSILQSLMEDCEFGQRVTAKERVTSRLIANREGETVKKKKNSRRAFEKMLLTQLPKMYSRGDRQCR